MIHVNCVPVVPTPEPDVVLGLTMEQVVFLRRLLGCHVGGSSRKGGARALSDQIFSGLRGATLAASVEPFHGSENIIIYPESHQ